MQEWKEVEQLEERMLLQERKVEPFQTMTVVVASQREDEILEMCGMVVTHAAGEALARRGLEGSLLCIRGTRAGQV